MLTFAAFSFALPFVALRAVAASTESYEVSPQGRGRRLFTFGQEREHIWGRCSKLARGNSGCTLKDETTCSNFLSSGPAKNGTTLQIKLGGLRQAGERSEEMHLQWWAPRESSTRYDPMTPPYRIETCDVYRDVLDAYPKYYDRDFNGGNVEVDENGEAIISFDAPSTFQLSCYIAYPHVNLRFCMGDNFASFRRDSIFFTFEGPFVSASCWEKSLVQILGWRYAGDTDWMAPPSTPYELTSATPPTSAPTATPAPVIDLRIQSAKDALDLSALEFSPIYNCFMEGKFFDQFSSGCVTECPPSSAVKHGQCVKKEISQTSLTLSASWLLDVKCDAECWNDKKTARLHELRLALADHLDIPFQEAAVHVSFLSTGERRLNDKETESQKDHQMRLSVTVNSRRVSATQDHEHLRNNFIVVPEDASLHFGMKVTKVVPDHDGAMAPVDEQDDPYTPSYDTLEPKAGSAPIAPLSTGELPAMAIICIAAAIMVIASAFAVFMWFKRRAAVKKQNDIAESNAVAEKTASVEHADEKIADLPEPTKGSAVV